MEDTDTARARYVSHFYGAVWTNPLAYHLWIDSTAIPLETSVELIIQAARSRLALAERAPSA